MYCHKCGKEQAEDDKFCSNCRQNSIEQGKPDVKPVQNTTGQLKMTLATFLWFLFGISLVFRLSIDFFSLSVIAFPLDSYGALGVFICLSTYFLPTIISLKGHYRKTKSIFLLNLLLWLGYGIWILPHILWVVALIWAVSEDRFENSIKKLWTKK